MFEISARYGLFVLVLIDSIFVMVATRRGIEQEITIFGGFLGFHRRNGFWKTTCAKVVVSILAGYPTVVFGRPALFLIYSVHVVVFAYKLFFKKYIV